MAKTDANKAVVTWQHLLSALLICAPISLTSAASGADPGADTAPLTATEKRQLAEFYFAKGQSLFQPAKVSPEAAQEGYEALQQALALTDENAPRRAEYLYRRDVALMILGRMDLALFEEDA